MHAPGTSAKKDTLKPQEQTSQQNVSSRNPVALKPGRSLVDWVRYSHNAKDLASTGGKCIEVTPNELSKHNTKNNAWICLKGKIYNITPYMEYHPGGEDELMRGAGKDATDLFNQIHQWVNAETMLRNCFVGVLKRPLLAFPKLKSGKTKLFKSRLSPAIFHALSKTCNEDTVKDDIGTGNTNLSLDSYSQEISDDSPIFHALSKTCSGDTVKDDIATGITNLSSDSCSQEISDESPKFDWSETETEVMLTIQVNCKVLSLQKLITHLKNKDLLSIINRNPPMQQFHINLSKQVMESYEVNVEPEQKEIKIILLKEEPFPWINSNKPFLVCTKYEENDDHFFWLCKLLKKTSVTHNTYLFDWELPIGVKMWTPLGHHIQMKSQMGEMDIVRSYTPVLPSLSSDYDLDGRTLSLMIKIYPDGALTPLIDQCLVGEPMWMSLYSGSFSQEILEECEGLVMLAAGTGITPMIRILHYVAKQSIRSMLLFFNRQERDILWRQEFDYLSSRCQNFHVEYVLSEPEEGWNGFSGRINSTLLRQMLMPTNQRYRFLICGPHLFVEATEKCLQELGYQQHSIHIFSA